MHDNNNTKTGAPGEASALRHSPGRVPTIARPDSAPGAGKMSMPEHKTALKVAVVCCGSGNAGGVVKGASPSAYLGHFRNADVLKRGHNQGAPGEPVPTAAPGFQTPPGRSAQVEQPGFATPAAPPTMTMAPGMRSNRPTFDPVANPIAAARQENRTARQAVKMGGGNMGEVRAENKARMFGARAQRQLRNAQGFHASDRASLAAAKKEARAPQPAQTPKAALGSAIGNVRAARGAVANTMKRPKGY